MSQESERIDLLKVSIPELFETTGTLLYVGASRARAQCLSMLESLGYEVTILEPWLGNVEHYRSLGKRVIQGDIRQVELDYYTTIFWWHGPEHITKGELPGVLTRIEASTNLIILASPWGKYPQDAVGGNPYEVHESSLYPGDYESLGYEVVTLGKPDRGWTERSHILAWKFMRRSSQ